MRLLKEIPEMEEKINSGEISLTHMGIAQSLFSKEKKASNEFSREGKIEVLKKISNTSAREAEKITLSMLTNPVAAKPDKVKLITNNLVELRFVASDEVQKKIEHLKGLLAHKSPNISLGELFEQLCDLGIHIWENQNSAAPKKRCAKDLSAQKCVKPLSKAAIKREVFTRAQNSCENCGSHYALEIDHIRPHALGGNSDLENLRILCRSCNQRAAIEVFGADQMQFFLN